ncbi:MAG: tetratricopeptide repeat protein [Hormoscilla sp.]
MKISLCAIVKDEEASLPSCLNSVKDVVDEMVVVDTGSTDRTPAIAKELGAKVYRFPQDPNLSPARNFSLEQATGDWILVLDADEELSPHIVPQIKEAIAGENYILINLIRQEIGATQSPYSLVSRLFRKHPDIKFDRPYHQMVDDSIIQLLQREPKWQVGHLESVAIAHYGYQPGTIAAKNKYIRALTAMEAYLAAHPDDPYTCSKLGALYVQMQEVAQGIALLEKALPLTSEEMVLYELHYHLAIAYSRQGNLPKAQHHYQSAAELPILRKLKIGAYNNWGNLRKESGNIVGAMMLYQQTIQIDPSFAIGHYNLGMAWKQLGRLDEAIAAYQQALKLNPTYAEAYQNLGVALLKGGNVSASLAAFQEAIALHEQHNPAEAKRIRTELAKMDFHV